MPKHKYIETPEKMWSLFEAYRDLTKKNPILVQDYVGKDGNMVYREKERCLTMEGFENYCEENVGCVHHYFENTDERYDEYRDICSRIRRKIRQDQIEGGMSGIYNPSITQRLNGLVDKKEIEQKGEPRVFNINTSSND